MQESNKKKLIGIVLFVLFILGQNVFAATVEPTIQINYSKDKNGKVQGDIVVNNVPSKATALQVQMYFNENLTTSNLGVKWSPELDPNIYKTMKVIENIGNSNDIILYLVSHINFISIGNIKLGTIQFESHKKVSEIIPEMGYIKILQENMKPLEYNCKVVLNEIGSGEDNKPGDNDGSDNNGSSDDKDNTSDGSDKIEIINWQEMKNVENDKTFLITFSHELDSKEDMSKLIKVYDSNRNEVPCEFAIEGSKVRVTSKKLYESQKTYTMEVSHKIKSNGGQLLNKKLVMKFTIK